MNHLSLSVGIIDKVKVVTHFIIAESAPFIPNVSKPSERIGISRNSLLAYLDALHDSCLTMSLQKEGFGISRLQKPDKLF